MNLEDLPPPGDPAELFAVRGKVALVTGATTGIGLMIARQILIHGAKVYLHGRRADFCADVARRLSDIGPCIPAPADLGARDGAAKLIEQIKQNEKALHILVNNAGATLSGPVDDYSMEDWDQVFNVNVRAPFELCSRLARLLEADASPLDPGRIVNIGSLSGNLVTNSNSAFSYGPSKAALHHLSRGLAVELAKRNITVNSIAPGGFPTKIMDFEVNGIHAWELTAQQTPAGRMGTEEDIGGLLLFLCSRAGAYVTGTNIAIDGAWSVKGV
ncbi:MAG: SDR family oxidoreductase [Caulobacterales bacterium]